MRLDRYLAQSGERTRSEAARLLRSGAVRVNGEPVRDGGFHLKPDDRVELMGQAVEEKRYQYLMLHKPTSYECSHKPTFHPSVFTLLPPQMLLRDVQCVGRLDQDTTGLLLLSDDGQFIHRMSSPKKHVPKVYQITTKHPVDEEQISRLLAGVVLDDDPQPVKAAACEQTASHQVDLTLTEGKYHQVKRMLAAVGNRVERLHRSRIGALELPATLAPGEWKWLDQDELGLLTRTA